MAIAEVTTHACKETACSSFSTGGHKTTLLPVFTVDDLKDPTQFERMLNEISDNLDDRFQRASLDKDLIQLCAVTNGALVLDLGRSCKFHIETDEDINSITICCFDSHCSPKILIENTGGNPITVTGWPAGTSFANADDEIIVNPGDIGVLTLAVDVNCVFHGSGPTEPVPEELVTIKAPSIVATAPALIRPCTPADRGSYTENFVTEQTVATDRYQFDIVNTSGTASQDAFHLRAGGLRWQFEKATGGTRIRGIARRRFTIHFPTEGAINATMVPPRTNVAASYGIALGSGTEGSFDGYAMFLERDQDASMHVRGYRLFGADSESGSSSGSNRSGFALWFETTYAEGVTAGLYVSRCGVPGHVIFQLNGTTVLERTESGSTLAGPGCLLIYENGPAAGSFDSAGFIISLVHEGVNVFG